MQSVSFVGLGGMGGAIAARLANHFPLVVYDLDAARSAAVKGDDVQIASDLTGAFTPGGALITMLPDDKALRAVTLGENGAAAQLGKGGLHVNMSTVSPQLSRELAEVYEANGGAYVAAPVWGRPISAQEGNLVCALAGSDEAKTRARAFLEPVTKRIEDFGTAPHMANVAKVVGNFMVASTIETLGEALTVAEKHGLDRKALADLLVSTIFDCRIYRTYGPLVAAQERAPAGFTAQLGLKDLRLVREVAAEVGVPVPFQNIIENRLIATISKGRGQEDWSSMTWLAAEDAGLPRPIKGEVGTDD